MQIAELDKLILDIRTILYGDGQVEPSSDACAQLTKEFFQQDTFRLLIHCLPTLNSGVSINISFKMINSFFFLGTQVIRLSILDYSQARQNATHVIANLQRQRVNSKLIASEYLENNLDIMDILIPG